LSLQDWVDQVEKDQVAASKRGSRLATVWICDKGLVELVKQNKECPVASIDVIKNRVHVHGIPIRVHKKMRPGRFLYVMVEQ
jgi:hypothetical protein